MCPCPCLSSRCSEGVGRAHGAGVLLLLVEVILFSLALSLVFVFVFVPFLWCLCSNNLIGINCGSSCNLLIANWVIRLNVMLIYLVPLSSTL